MTICSALMPLHVGRSVGPPRALRAILAPPMAYDPEISPPSGALPAVQYPAGACGELALVGGAEWTPGCEEIDRHLLEASGTSEVVVLPTAAAYWHPDKAVQTSASYFAGLGASVKACMVLRRGDAEERENAGIVRAARFLYLAGGSVLHLRSVLKSSPVWDALVEAWGAGAVLAGSSAGAMVLGDAMVDPRGGALTLGLGLLPQLAVLPHAGDWSEEKMHRTVRLASGGLRIAAIDERTALLRAPDGHWYKRGQGNVTIWLDGKQVGLESLDKPGP